MTGLDAAEDMLRMARARVQQGTFHQGELEDLPFKEGAFDLVTGFNSIQYAASPAGALAEAERVVTGDGWVATVVYRPSTSLTSIVPSSTPI